MVASSVPQLENADLKVGADTRWVKFENYPIPSLFNVRFQFRDGTHRWAAFFEIGVSKQGTPTLLQVTVSGTSGDEFPISRITNEGPYHKPQYGVERWQLKLIEQHRFELLEMAIALAITMQGPNSKEDEQQWTSIEGSLSAIELKEITRQIRKRIRQRITPEFLQSVADTYTRAVLKKENPTEAVAEHFQCARRTAQEYVTKARQLTLLPPIIPGQVTVYKKLRSYPSFDPAPTTPGREMAKKPPTRKER